MIYEVPGKADKVSLKVQSAWNQLIAGIFKHQEKMQRHNKCLTFPC